MCAAVWGYYKRNRMNYSHLRGREYLAQFKPPPYVPHDLDCSGFATYCYGISNAPDPNGHGYAGGVTTGEIWNNPKAQKLTITRDNKILGGGLLQMGDLLLYGNPNSESGHVVVVIAFGKLVSMGGQGDPKLAEIKDYRRDELVGGRRILFQQ